MDLLRYVYLLGLLLLSLGLLLGAVCGGRLFRGSVVGRVDIGGCGEHTGASERTDFGGQAMNTDLTYHTELPTIFPGADQYVEDVCACCRSEVGYGEAVASPGESGYLILHRRCAVADQVTISDRLA